jgi:hypothetical protein
LLEDLLATLGAAAKRWNKEIEVSTKPITGMSRSPLEETQ